MYLCTHSGLALDESLGYCPNCNRTDCAVEDTNNFILSCSIQTECECNEDIAENCDGECFDMAYEDYEFLLKCWMHICKVDSDNKFLIKGRNLTWQRLSGHAEVDAHQNSLLNALRVNGDYRLMMTFNTTTSSIDVVRYSHDEPTGASMTVTVL